MASQISIKKLSTSVRFNSLQVKTVHIIISFELELGSISNVLSIKLWRLYLCFWFMISQLIVCFGFCFSWSIQLENMSVYRMYRTRKIYLCMVPCQIDFKSLNVNILAQNLQRGHSSLHSFGKGEVIETCG